MTVSREERCYPGDKPDELHALIAEEWFRPEEHLLAFVAALKERAA